MWMSVILCTSIRKEEKKTEKNNKIGTKLIKNAQNGQEPATTKRKSRKKKGKKERMKQMKKKYYRNRIFKGAI